MSRSNHVKGSLQKKVITIDPELLSIRKKIVSSGYGQLTRSKTGPSVFQRTVASDNALTIEKKFSLASRSKVAPVRRKVITVDPEIASISQRILECRYKNRDNSSTKNKTTTDVPSTTAITQTTGMPKEEIKDSLRKGNSKTSPHLVQNNNDTKSRNKGHEHPCICDIPRNVMSKIKANDAARNARWRAFKKRMRAIERKKLLLKETQETDKNENLEGDEESKEIAEILKRKRGCKKKEVKDEKANEKAGSSQNGESEEKKGLKKRSEPKLDEKELAKLGYKKRINLNCEEGPIIPVKYNKTYRLRKETGWKCCNRKTYPEPVVWCINWKKSPKVKTKVNWSFCVRRHRNCGKIARMDAEQETECSKTPFYNHLPLYKNMWLGTINDSPI